MIYPTLKPKPVPNFPQKLDADRTKGSTSVFPNDLLAEGRGYCTQIQFVDYKPLTPALGITGFNDQFQNIAVPSGGLFLPIPQRLNDNLTLNWTEFSFMDQATGVASAVAGRASGALGAVASAGSIALGYSLNPLMFLQFRRPEFRLFQLSWVLAPRTKKESETILNIVTKCKQAAAPTKEFQFLLGYPQIALIRILPNDVFGHMKFKPCVITSVQANYTPNPNPSFFEGTNAPSTVTLTLNLKEMSYWYRNEIK